MATSKVVAQSPHTCISAGVGTILYVCQVCYITSKRPKCECKAMQ